MRHPGGYAMLTNASGTLARFAPDARPVKIARDLHEVDTWTCKHCDSVVHAPTANKDTDYFFCRNCMARICDGCANRPCVPFMKQVEDSEARTRMYRAVGV